MRITRSVLYTRGCQTDHRTSKISQINYPLEKPTISLNEKIPNPIQKHTFMSHNSVNNKKKLNEIYTPL